MGARPSADRRHASRPRNGDTKPCPSCGKSGCCEFNDRYRFGDVGVAPAWICGCPPCQYRELARGADRRLGGRALVRQSREVGARAKRQMMKCHSLTQRSRTGQAKNQARLKGKS